MHSVQRADHDPAGLVSQFVVAKILIDHGAAVDEQDKQGAQVETRARVLPRAVPASPNIADPAAVEKELRSLREDGV